jgi:hypothetical protein
MSEAPDQEAPQRKPPPGPQTVHLPITGGGYSAPDLIANAQECINLYPEANPPANQPPVPVTQQLTPGIEDWILAGLPGAGTVRVLYTATNGEVFAVVDDDAYFVDVGGLTATLLGAVNPGNGPYYMKDNGIIVCVVDGVNGSGWTIDLTTHVLAAIVDPAWLTSTRVDFCDGFFIWNRPNTNQWYISPPFWDGITAIDGTMIASKTSGADPINAIRVMRGQVWLLGLKTSEVWTNTGGADFPFSRIPGVNLPHGMVQGHSDAVADTSVVWIGQDDQGRGVVFKADEYTAVRISNHFIERELQSYDLTLVSSCFTYQMDGHLFYVLNFSLEDVTWAYDFATGEWAKRAWRDPATGLLHRSRWNCFCYADSLWLVGDRANGKIYRAGPDLYEDDGDPILRRRGFPHLVKDGRRLSYARFQIDMDVSDTSGGAGTEDLIVRFSDTRGATFGSDITVPVVFGGATQDYQSLVLARLGMARDRVFEVEWMWNRKTAIQGAWIDIEKAET